MTADWNDDEIKRAFTEWRKSDSGLSPPFAGMYAAAQAGATARASIGPWKRGALAAAALVVGAAGWLLLEPRAPQSASRLAREVPMAPLSEWRSPTAFLLLGPGDVLVKTIPTVSAGSAELNVLGVRAANRRPS